MTMITVEQKFALCDEGLRVIARYGNIPEAIKAGKELSDSFYVMNGPIVIYRG
jgi:hypothetical protein